MSVLYNIEVIKDKYSIRNRNKIFLHRIHFHQFPSIFIGKISYRTGNYRKLCIIFVFVFRQICFHICFERTRCFFLSINIEVIAFFHKFKIWHCTYNRISSKLVNQRRIQKHTVICSCKICIKLCCTSGRLHFFYNTPFIIHRFFLSVH